MGSFALGATIQTTAPCHLPAGDHTTTWLQGLLDFPMVFCYISEHILKRFMKIQILFSVAWTSKFCPDPHLTALPPLATIINNLSQRIQCSLPSRPSCVVWCSKLLCSAAKFVKPLICQTSSVQNECDISLITTTSISVLYLNGPDFFLFQSSAGSSHGPTLLCSDWMWILTVLCPVAAPPLYYWCPAKLYLR